MRSNSTRGVMIIESDDGRHLRRSTAMLFGFVAQLALVASLGLGFVPGNRAPARAQAPAGFSFVDVTRSSGVANEPTLSWGSTWVDHDADGDVDLFVNRHWKAARLYVRRPRGYLLSGQSFHSGPRRFFDRHTCSWGEANGDGRADLYCDSGAQQGQGKGSNQLWIRTESGYENRSRVYRVRDPLARSRSVNWLDYDSDGDLDIFTASKLRDGYPNSLFRNDRGEFEKVHVGLTKEMNGLNSTWSDWDNDGDPDLLVLRYHPAHAVAYENLGGKFTALSIAGVTDTYWSSASWGDYDGDGWTDLQLVNHQRSVVMRNSGGSLQPIHEAALARGASSSWIDADNDGDLDSYIVQAKESGVNKPDIFLVNDDGAFRRFRNPSFGGIKGGSGETASVADYDRDGSLDLFVTNGATIFEESLLEGRPVLLRNRTQAGNWIRLVLHGDLWNPWGFGSRVTVDAEGLRYEREVNDGMTFRSQSQVGQILLGLGSETQATVEVRWPDGGSDCVAAAAGQTAHVRKGASSGC